MIKKAEKKLPKIGMGKGQGGTTHHSPRCIEPSRAEQRKEPREREKKALKLRVTHGPWAQFMSRVEKVQTAEFIEGAMNVLGRSSLFYCSSMIYGV